jgi:hypothetical protein
MNKISISSRIRFIRILIISIGICLAVNTQGQHSTTKKYAKAITESHRLIDSLLHAGKIPGIDIAVSINGEILGSDEFDGRLCRCES